MLTLRKFFTVLFMAGTLTAAAPLVTLESTPAHARASGTFQTLEGAWRGAGKIMLTDGQSQQIRCRAYYRVDGGGSELGFAIRCAARTIGLSCAQNSATAMAS